MAQRQQRWTIAGAIAGVVGVGAAVAYALRKPPVVGQTTPPGTPAKAGVAVTQELPATIQVAVGAHLPDYAILVTNLGGTAADFTVDVATQSGSLHFALDTRRTDMQPYAVSGFGMANGKALVKALAPGKSVTLYWTAAWDATSGGGPFSLVTTVEVAGVAQTFPDSQTFSVTTTQLPAALQVALSGGPGGSYSQVQGTVTTHIGGALQAVITNTGGQTYSGAISCIIAPAGSNTQAGSLEFFTTYGQPAGAAGVASVAVTIAPGASITIQWFTNWDFEPATDGTYHAVLVANP